MTGISYGLTSFPVGNKYGSRQRRSGGYHHRFCTMLLSPEESNGVHKVRNCVTLGMHDSSTTLLQDWLPYRNTHRIQLDNWTHHEVSQSKLQFPDVLEHFTVSWLSFVWWRWELHPRPSYRRETKLNSFQFATMPTNYIWLAFFWILGKCACPYFHHNPTSCGFYQSFP